MKALARELRDKLTPKMVCPAAGCGARLLITPSGMLACENGCGKLLPLSHLDQPYSDPNYKHWPTRKVRLPDLLAAFPDRIIEPSAERLAVDRPTKKAGRQISPAASRASSEVQPIHQSLLPLFVEPVNA